jgi:hypothetical protein
MRFLCRIMKGTADPGGRSVCGHSFTGTTGSSLVFVVCYVGSGLCDELIPRSGESYQAFVCVCVCVCVI